MKKIILIMMIFSASLSAADWSSEGYTLKSTHKEGDIITDVLSDKDGNALTVSYMGELNDQMIQFVKKMNSDFRSWESMKVDNLKFSFTGNENIQIFVKPSSYQYKDVDLMTYVSNGIMFTYRVNLVYNFRIMVDKLFVPIKGIFLEEKSFNDKILSAIKDPTTYINARDPEYLLEKLEKVTTDLERLRAAYLASLNGYRLVDKEIIDKVLELKSKNPSYTGRDIYKEMRDEKIRVSSGTIKDILRIYYNEEY